MCSQFYCVPRRFFPDFSVFPFSMCPWEILSGFKCVPIFNVSLGDSLRISVCSQFQCVPGRFSPDFNVFPVSMCLWEILSGFQCVPSSMYPWEILSGFQCVPSFNGRFSQCVPNIHICSSAKHTEDRARPSKLRLYFPAI